MRGIRWQIILGVAVLALVLPEMAMAHLERPSYWPDPRLTSRSCPPAGGAVPEGALAHVRGHRQGPGRGARGVPGAGRDSLQPRAAVDPQGTRSRASSCARASRRSSYSASRRGRLERINRALKREVPVQRRSRRRSTTRGNNDRVVIMPGRYTRAEVARRAAQRPEVQPVHAAEGRERRAHAELRVPGDLPQRPEPVHVQGRAVDGRAARRAAARRPPRASPSRSSARACAATSRSRARAPSPTDVILDAGNELQGQGPVGQARRATPSTWCCAWTALTASWGATS